MVCMYECIGTYLYIDEEKEGMKFRFEFSSGWWRWWRKTYIGKVTENKRRKEKKGGTNLDVRIFYDFWVNCRHLADNKMRTATTTITKRQQMNMRIVEYVYIKKAKGDVSTKKKQGGGVEIIKKRIPFEKKRFFFVTKWNERKCV